MNPSQFKRFWMVARQELALLSRERGLWMAAGLFALLIGYALFNGMWQTQHSDRAQAALIADDAQSRGTQLVLLQRILSEGETPSPFANPANPANMAGSYGAQHAVMPSTALAPVALGQTDLFPSQFKVTHQSKVNFLHNNDIENPWHLLSGHFDLAFVIVYLLPLLIFALSYNLLSAERESGALRLLLSQPLALPTLIAGKVAVRAAVLLGAAVLVPVAVLLAARPQAATAASHTLWWAVLVAAYLSFWFAMVVAVNSFGKSSAANAMALVGSWVLLVLVAPVVLNLAVTQLSPAPSRAELATRTRVVTAEAMAKNAALLATDYKHMDKPETLRPKDGRIEMSGRAYASYKIQRQVDERIQPELDRFDAHLARQRELVSTYSVLSPAAVAYEGITALAGTGQRRHAYFMAQVSAYHQAWKDFFFPRIEQGRAMSAEDFRDIPGFTWKEEAPSVVRTQAVAAVLQLSVPTLALLALAAWKLHRYRIV